MKQSILLLLLLFTLSPIYAQSVTDLYNQRNFPELIKLENNAGTLSSDELYMVGYAFFQLENDAKAIEYYDKAIAKGMDNGSVHFYKGLSLRYQKKYSEAEKEINISLQKEPANQEYMNEKGMIYRSQQDYDKALAVFEEAQKLPNTYPEPYYWAGTIYYDRKDYTKALSSFYKAAELLPTTNSLLFDSWKTIGLLEYVKTKDYVKSAVAYTNAIAIKPDDYELYQKLMKSYNAAKKFKQADSVFAIVQKAFEAGKLPKEDMEIKTVSVAEFKWNGQTATIRRALMNPTKTLDVSYKIFLTNKAGDKIERRFLVEKTFEMKGDKLKCLLCENDKENNTHITYDYGWNTDVVPLDELQDLVTAVLDGKIKPRATSTPGK